MRAPNGDLDISSPAFFEVTLAADPIDIERNGATGKSCSVYIIIIIIIVFVVFVVFVNKTTNPKHSNTILKNYFDFDFDFNHIFYFQFIVLLN